MKMSKSSIITEHFGKNSSKQSERAFQSSSVHGHVGKNNESVANIGSHLWRILETEG